MSLRARIAVVLLLATVALGASGLAIARVLATTARAREDAARARSAAAAEELARTPPAAMLAESGSEPPPEPRGPPPPGPEPHPPRDRPERPPPLAAPIAPSPALRSLGLGDAGLCTDSGTLLGSVGITPPGIAQRRLPPPETRRSIAEACAGLGQGERVERMVEVAGMQGALTVVRSSREHLLAWAIAAIGRPTDESTGWRLPVVILAGATGALIIVCLNALWALQRGIGQLEKSLRGLQENLRAPVETPRTTELARVGSGVLSLAKHLAEARDRERMLERRVESDRRLSALGRITAGIAHEVRNPLATLKLRLQLLDGGNGPASTHPDVLAAIQGVDRVDAVVRSLLAVAKSNSVQPQPLHLGPWVDLRLARLAPEAETRGIRLLREGDASALADPAALERVLDNLLSNALDAAPPSSRVTIRLEESGATTSLVVRDAGAGVPRESEGELFEPFFTTRSSGTGLGLWLSRSLVEAQGGSIAYQHDASGTELRVLLARAAS